MYNLENLQNYAKENEGRCLSNKYITNSTIYKWRCKNSHEFEKTWTTLLRANSAFCTKCKKNIIDELKIFAIQKEGKLLSKNYDTSNTLYKWRCKNSHEFEKSWTEMKRSSWFCIKCNKDNEITIDKLKNFAKEKNGECISEKYINSTTNYEWKCENFHIWKATWVNVGYNNATWCKKCNEWDFEKIQKYVAENKNGKCLKIIDGYGIDGRYLFECDENHRWKTKTGNVIYNNTWCASCLKLTIEDCFYEAEKRGGKCLDTIYINKRTDINWECSNGHQFKCPLGAVRNNNRWCKECAIDNMKLDISEAHTIAEEREGKCLTKIYINCDTHMEWRCKEGHEFLSTLTNIKNGNWCSVCYKIQRLTKSLNRIEEWLRLFNGKLLTNKESINFELTQEEIELQFECENSHVWEKTMDKINNESQCPKCLIVKRRVKAINKLEEWIISFKGNLLSNKEDMINFSSHFNEFDIQVKCHKGHIWSRTIEVFRNKTWCPKCKFRSESACREILDELFDTNFIKRRLKCMDYLELDGYCEKNKIGFEYNGIQHEQYIKHFHRNGIQDFFKQQNRDEIKKQLCKKNDIILLNIPSTYSYTNNKKLRKFIIDELERNGIIFL